jgi:RNA polymerase sigma-70 factor (ECF subfamily)
MTGERMAEPDSPEAHMAAFRRTGDPAEMDALVAEFIRPALGVARELLRDAALAEDAVQDAFLRVVRRRKQYQPGRSFASWFFTILRNTCTDRLRRQAREARSLRNLAEQSPTHANPEPPGATRETLAAARTARAMIDELPADERAVLTLRLVHEMPLRNVADALGVSYEAVKKRAQRGLRRLRERCRAEGIDGLPGEGGD